MFSWRRAEHWHRLVLILTTRFISNLRQSEDDEDSFSDSTVKFDSGTLSQSVQTGRLLGSLGGELQLDDYGSGDWAEGEDEEASVAS